MREIFNLTESHAGGSLENEGNSNPLCGEPANLDNLSRYVYRCELYGRYVNVKKTDIPAATLLVILEVLVNKEPTSKYCGGFGNIFFFLSKYSYISTRFI